MKVIVCVFFAVFIGVFSQNALSEVYRSVDANGVVTYSDQPNLGGKEVIVQPPNITTLSTTSVISKKDSASKTNVKTPEEKVPYTSFVIQSPKDQETFYNQTQIDASVTIEPALQSGDLIQFYLNAEAIGKASDNTAIVIPRVSDDKEILTRGSHTLHAVIINAEGNVIETTPSITVFVHQSTVQQQR